jgi:hypothetical protein
MESQPPEGFFDMDYVLHGWGWVDPGTFLQIARKGRLRKVGAVAPGSNFPVRLPDNDFCHILAP